jgi:hypothetical protein
MTTILHGKHSQKYYVVSMSTYIYMSLCLYVYLYIYVPRQERLYVYLYIYVPRCSQDMTTFLHGKHSQKYYVVSMSTYIYMSLCLYVYLYIYDHLPPRKAFSNVLCLLSLKSPGLEEDTCHMRRRILTCMLCLVSLKSPGLSTFANTELKPLSTFAVRNSSPAFSEFLLY